MTEDAVMQIRINNNLIGIVGLKGEGKNLPRNATTMPTTPLETNFSIETVLQFETRQVEESGIFFAR